MYDPEIDKWNVINPLFEGQSEAGASVVGDKIYWIPFLGLGLRNCAQKETQKSNFFQKFRKPPLLMSLEAIPGVNAKTCKLSLATTLIKKTGRVITIFQRLWLQSPAAVSKSHLICMKIQFLITWIFAWISTSLVSTKIRVSPTRKVPRSSEICCDLGEIYKFRPFLDKFKPASYFLLLVIYACFVFINFFYFSCF